MSQDFIEVNTLNRHVMVLRSGVALLKSEAADLPTYMTYCLQMAAGT